MVDNNNDAAKAAKRSGLLMVVGLIAGLFFLGFLGWSACSLSGHEFSPTHFQTRRFELKAFFGVQLRKISHTDLTDATSQYLVAQKLVTVPKEKPKRWDLVHISRSSSTGGVADSSILIRYLESGVWEQWSVDHPKAAAVLWPLVQRMAIDDLYLLLPGVFEIAETETNPVRLQAAIDGYLCNDLPMFARDMFASGREKDALALLNSAAKHYPYCLGIKDTLSELSTSP